LIPAIPTKVHGFLMEIESTPIVIYPRKKQAATPRAGSAPADQSPHG